MILQTRHRHYLLLHTKNLQQLFAYQQFLSDWRLIPTPPEITSGCGQSLKFDLTEDQFVLLHKKMMRPNASGYITDILETFIGENLSKIQKQQLKIPADLFLIHSKQGTREVWHLKI